MNKVAIFSMLLTIATASFFGACKKEDALPVKVGIEQVKPVKTNQHASKANSEKPGDLKLDGKKSNPVNTKKQYKFSWWWGIPADHCIPHLLCMCWISAGSTSIDAYTMTGTALARSPEEIIMDMDGSMLDPGFFELFDTGNYPFGADFILSDEVVEDIYSSGNFHAPNGSTVFQSGNKEVIVYETSYCVIFPVSYEDGSSATWYVNIHR